ncbi:FGGY-family carbohydrate kinase [Kaistia sp. UC242_56]|uniref:FGGY-family carbohydrate kinase n=1 Tax=Kaistia sp. UC242_56 TaxID=3374625 RepID=UPI0037A88085
MADVYLLGLDFGTESARGVRIHATTGEQEASHTHPYRHGVMTSALPDGTALPPAYALQDAADYLEAAEAILTAIGGGFEIAGIGIGFTASTPLPARADGTPLSALLPDEPHAFVKLWKHAAAQPYADAINAQGGRFLKNFGGRLSGEWMLAKAAQIEAEAPAIWKQADRFIEAGDWLVWQLTGLEARSLDFAAYKAQFSAESGYPNHTVPGLADRLSPPLPVGSAAGLLAPGWHERTGIRGDAVVAVAVIDSHVVLPAVDGIAAGTLVGALGTSAAYLLLGDRAGELPDGIEGVADGAVLPDLACYEAGQAGFGDILAWYIRNFPRAETVAESFRLYDESAASLNPGQSRLMALDWWSGNRVPYADSSLSGLLVGLNLSTSSTQIYRALLEALCYGARSIFDHLAAGDLPIDRVILTSGLSRRNPLLLQIMADVLGREIEVPDIANPTAVGAAIHGAVAAGVVPDFAAGAARFGARRFDRFTPDPAATGVYASLYQQYRQLAADDRLRQSMRALGTAGGFPNGSSETSRFASQPASPEREVDQAHP